MKKLVLGYGTETMRVRKNLATVMLLRDNLCNRIDSISLLLKINIYVPGRNIRNRFFFSIPNYRTSIPRMTLINQAKMLYNKLLLIDNSLDIFFDSRKKFYKKILLALNELENYEF